MAGGRFDRGRDLVSGPARTLLPMELSRALSHSSNYVVGAFQGQLVAGFLLAFYGRLATGGHHLHFHILGVRSEMQVRGVGSALKFQHAEYRGVGRTRDGSYVVKRSV